MIRIKSLNKSFGEIHALKNVDITVPKGRIYGLVGTNGSGKTTILKSLAGILKADAGQVTIDGQDTFENEEVKTRIGFIPDDLYFHGNCNLTEMASIYKGLYPDWDQERFDRIVETFELDRRRKIFRFSKGMQKQAKFALTVATKPDYLILDEPVDGLDPLARRTVWDIIVNDVAEREMTVLISSHNLKEIEGICDMVGIISKGEMRLERELDDLRSQTHKIQVAFNDDNDDRYSKLNVLKKEKTGSIDMLIVNNTAEEVKEALEHEAPIILDILPLTLEEVFIYELGGSDNEYRDILS